MDYFAHGMWGYIIFHKTKKPLYAVLFGMLPDTASWFIYLIYVLFKGPRNFGPPVSAEIPDWVWTLYNISHSLIVCAIIFIIIYVLLKKIPVYMWAWPLHILIDIPLHSREFLPTPFLWPGSDWYFPGISWGTPWFMIVNWSLIFVFFGYILFKKYKKKRTAARRT